MVKHLTAMSIALLLPGPIAATQPARLEFERATEHEQSARASLSEPHASVEVLAEIGWIISLS